MPTGFFCFIFFKYSMFFYKEYTLLTVSMCINYVVLLYACLIAFYFHIFFVFETLSMIVDKKYNAVLEFSICLYIACSYDICILIYIYGALYVCSV